MIRDAVPDNAVPLSPPMRRSIAPLVRAPKANSAYFRKFHFAIHRKLSSALGLKTVAKNVTWESSWLLKSIFFLTTVVMEI
jgi:hypothetical protein